MLELTITSTCMCGSKIIKSYEEFVLFDFYLYAVVNPTNIEQTLWYAVYLVCVCVCVCVCVRVRVYV